MSDDRSKLAHGLLKIVAQSRQQKRTRIPRVNAAEESFLYQVKLLGLPLPNRNYKFHATRRWEIDFAWPTLRIGVEIQGGIWSGGKHGRGAGIVKDMEKHNILLDMRWRVWQYTPRQVTSGEALKHLESMIRSMSSQILNKGM